MKAPENSGPSSSRATLVVIVVVIVAEWRRTRRHRSSCNCLCISYIAYYEQFESQSPGWVSLTWTHRRRRRRCHRLVWPWRPTSYHPRYGTPWLLSTNRSTRWRSIIIHPSCSISGSRPVSAPSSSSSFRAGKNSFYGGDSSMNPHKTSFLDWYGRFVH